MKRNIKLIIEYDGTSYNGWQTQVNAVAISDVISMAIKEFTGEEINLIGASRTDSGVHAYGQVANFNTFSKIPAEKILFAINNKLPPDIVVKESKEEISSFHSRFDANGKTYIYKIFNNNVISPFQINRAYHIKYPLNFKEMSDACNYFVGTKDFSSFRASGCSSKNSIKTITNMEIKKNNSLIEIEITGNSFLYNMVRIIAGTIVDVGLGRILVKEIPEIFVSKDRRQAGKTLPACGLYLKEVYYK
jgi:tRNA pseudouridine38-40 synthase